MSARSLKAGAEALKREGILADHIKTRLPGPFDAASLARSFAIDATRVTQIISRHGGVNG